MTIAKNTNRAKQAIKNAHDIRCYSLSNNFSGQPLASDPVVWRNGSLLHVAQQDFLLSELFSGIGNAKLSFYDGHYTVHVNSNLWYEFKA